MYKKPLIQSIGQQTFAASGIHVSTLRLDMVHPHVSGNKLYKLKYYLEEAAELGKKGIISFGGAYSNHLVALAFACKEKGLQAMGIIRGEEPATYGPSLAQMKELGMTLIFVTREEYKNRNEHLTTLIADYPDFLVVDEGGAGYAGVKGASEIMNFVDTDYSHIICAVGTGTTIAGIINNTQPHQQVIGISVLKIANKTDNELLRYISNSTTQNNWQLLYDYHWGGYARYNESLLSFMNNLYSKENIPTDFVYTGKLFYAVNDLIEKKSFNPGSKILIIHSGGLQGNRSVEKGKLIF